MRRGPTRKGENFLMCTRKILFRACEIGGWERARRGERKGAKGERGGEKEAAREVENFLESTK